ncbi:hypothetical protein DFP72DRAFT_833486 [Ephemerocybe angulata]|uniref:Fe2OG dioxygenase domain-containing protein n=1 Tax=Ephemerocybe angulata TaxID=980116 RepID=A0A8H6H6N1_9AGAR|nr:hypothetical protein DFP72DRAFT_833486 [Tulosesus angulatus]
MDTSTSESPSGPNLDVTPYPGFLLAAARTESTFDEIPVIDISDAFSTDSEARRKLADEIRDACVNVGFFYVKSHGIKESTIEKAIAAAKDFFALPEEVKMEIDIHKSSNFKGYTPLLGENTDVTGNGDLHEGFDIGWESGQLNFGRTAAFGTEIGPMSGKNVWPEGLIGFKDAVLDHSALALGRVLFPLFALALDMPKDWFDDKTKQSAAIMRLLHYPPQNPTKVDQGQIGIGEHTDYECFTLLWQDKAGGLQVKNASGKWIDAIPIPGTIVVNLGDQFARWTDDVFKSTPHRVINRSGAERYSIPVFFGTDYDVLLQPIPTCLSPGRTPQYEVVSAGDYVKSRLEATYAQSTVSTKS